MNKVFVDLQHIFTFSLHDYLMYEVVRSLIYEYNLTFQTWQSKGDSKIDFCVSKAIDM